MTVAPAFRRVNASLLLGLVFALTSAAPARATSLTILSENFDSVAGLAGAGWVTKNNSAPVGPSSWFQGNALDVFPSQAGAPNSYVAANYLNAADPGVGGGNISNWLISPTLTLNNFDTINFYTRSAGTFADRLEVRLSTNGASTDVGATDVSVGDFTTLLLTVNPLLDPIGYPDAWTMFTATLGGLGGPTSGRFAFRYTVPDTSVNGNYIGLDTLTVNAAVPEPGTMTMLGVGLLALVRSRRRASRRRSVVLNEREH